MAKTDFILTPKNIHRINSITFDTNKEGNLTAINVTAEVNFGTEGRDISMDILPKLTANQLKIAQGFYDGARKILEREILG